MTNPEHTRWLNENGEFLRYQFPLTPESVVVDAGGYKGDWSGEIYKRYFPYIHIFEPILYFSRNIKARFADHGKIKVYDAGLSDETREEKIYLNADSSSLHSATEHFQVIQLISFDEFLLKSGVEKIDLMKINIEGEEYRLLIGMIEKNNIEKVRRFLIQFHDNIEGCQEKYDFIASELGKTHRLIWQYKNVWECWEKII